MDMLNPESLKRAVAKIDLESVADDAAQLANEAKDSALKMGRETFRDLKKLSNRHPHATGAVVGGLVVLGVVGLVAWLRD